MVTNFTANQIGDFMFAKLVDPYVNTTKVTGWNITAGVSTPNTIGTLAMTLGEYSITGTNTSLDLVVGDKIIVANYTLTVDAIVSPTEFTIIEGAPITTTGIQFYKTPDVNNHFEYSYRFSQNGSSTDGGQMSPARLLNMSTGPNDILGQTFDATKPLWLDVKAEVNRLGDYNTITMLSVTFELLSTDGIVESCPQFCGDCVDPWSMSGCANIVIDCEGELFDPYNLQRPTDTYRDISELSSEMWGHSVKYFRVEPDKRSSDVILMEYSLYNVMESADLKIMVPDNEMPSQEFQYDIFGMGFEDFEIHLTQGQFKTAFGLGSSPRSRDYLYFPLMNRMYEVRSVAFADEFNMDMTYWRLMLTKYEERTSSIHTDTAIEQQVDDLVTGLEEVFGEEIQEEYAKVTKPAQYQTVFSEVQDGTRYKIHNDLMIKDTEIRNQWTIIAKNCYDMSSIKDIGVEALQYVKKSQHASDKNLAVTLWFRPNATAFTGTKTTLDLIKANTGDKGLSIKTSSTELTLKLNNDTHSFTYDSQLEATTWYGVVINLSNTYTTLDANVYRLDPLSNWKQGKSTAQETVTSVLSQKIDNITPYGWVTTDRWSLMPGKHEITNFRLFNRVIGTEQHFNMLQQYVVRDNQYAHIIDNAIPSIQLRRYNQAR
tara:strand:+ start:1807 stop:3771 length:1965 start_codon:yes stop_codon:yes gene_type:complete